LPERQAAAWPLRASRMDTCRWPSGRGRAAREPWWGFCPVGGIIRFVIQRQPDPALERGFIVAALSQGVDSESELAELRDLARTALVEPIDELVQHRARTDSRTYLSKG